MADSEGGDGEGRPLRALHRFEDAVLAVLLTAMILLASLQIVLRNLFDGGVGWADPMVRVLVLWVGLLGALAAARDDDHINVDVLTRLLPEGTRPGVRLATSLFTAAVAGTVAYQAARFVASEIEFGGVAFAGLPTWALALVLPFSFGGIALRYLLHSLRHARALRRAASGSG